MGKILVCPDCHGRNFWKKPCIEHKDEFDKIVFLGDYLSCYPDEWGPGIDYKRIAIERFKEIIEFKKENPDKVVLLFGNHDGSYFNTEICECRTDFKNWREIHNLFTENIKLFDLAWETKVNDTRYFFSHAGIRKEWLRYIIHGDFLFKWDDKNVVPPASIFNNVFHVAYDGDGNEEVKGKLESALGVYSTYRGWDGASFGSIVWADIREYLTREYDDVVFICGHTQLANEPVFLDGAVDLDVRKAFVFDTETGEVKEYVAD